MALSTIGVGSTANDGTGDPLRTAFQTVNTAITAVNNAIAVDTGTTTFKDDGGTRGVRVAANGDISFLNANASVGVFWDETANSNNGSIGIGISASLTAPLHVNNEVAGASTIAAFGTNAAIDALKLITTDGTLTWGFNCLNSRNFVIQTNQIERCRAASNGDFTWKNDGTTVGMTWDSSARSNAGALGVATSTPTAAVDINSDVVRLRTSKTPASATATGNAGDICWDASYIYVCTASNTWKRVAIATW
jgi:hypothetical protein